MADRRKRIYYNNSQVTRGLITNGKEWMHTDGTEYIGQYHRYVTGEVFTEASFVADKSRKLIPYVDQDNVRQQQNIGIDLALNYEYDQLKVVDVKTTKRPNPPIIQPSTLDYTRGYITRYFAKKRNEAFVLELSQEDFNAVGSANGLSQTLWIPFSIRWKIVGPINDVVDSNGNIIEPGIADTNLRTVELNNQKYNGLSDLISNYLEFLENA